MDSKNKGYAPYIAALLGSFILLMFMDQVLGLSPAAAIITAMIACGFAFYCIKSS